MQKLIAKEFAIKIVSIFLNVKIFQILILTLEMYENHKNKSKYFAPSHQKQKMVKNLYEF